MIHEQFESVSSNPELEVLPDFEPKERLSDIHHISITKPVILKLLLNINPKKADGPDGIPGKILNYVHMSK